MSRQRTTTTDDVIRYIEDHAPPEGVGVRRNPFAGSAFDLTLVEAAISELRLMGKLLDLQPFDIKGTLGLWTREGWPNYDLARRAVKRLLRALQEETRDPLERVLPRITRVHFLSTPINRYRTTIEGALGKVYEGSPYAALKDLLDHDPDLGEYRDFQPHDMLNAPRDTWGTRGARNAPLARKLVRRLLEKLREETGESLERLLTRITADDFERHPVNRYGTTLGGMLASVYGASPYRALRDLIDNDPELAEHRGFEPYDMRRCPPETWVDRAGVKNLDRSRAATKRLLERLRAGRPETPLEQVLRDVDDEHFRTVPINRYGTTLGGMVDRVYGGSPYRALKDLIHHDPGLAEYRDLEPYDMRRAPTGTWVRRGGVRNFALARRAVKRLMRRLQEETNEPLERLLPRVGHVHFTKQPIDRYGTTLAAMVATVYRSSPYAALRDLIDHDPDLAAYRDLEPYDMLLSPQGTWLGRNGTAHRALARRATKRLLEKLIEERGEPLEKLLPRLGPKQFSQVSIDRYGATLGGMLVRVYGGSTYAAVKDVIDHDPGWAELRDLRPYDLHGSHVWTASDGRPDFALARRLTRTVLDQARAETGEPWARVLPWIGRKHFRRAINRFGTALEGMLLGVYGGSPYVALRDLIDHDPALGRYRDLKPYDMRQAPDGTWSASGTKNFSLAREAVGQLLRRLREETGRPLEEVIGRLKTRDFVSHPINQFGTTLGGMLQTVYGSSVSEALRDLCENDPRYRPYAPR